MVLDVDIVLDLLILPTGEEDLLAGWQARGLWQGGQGHGCGASGKLADYCSLPQLKFKIELTSLKVEKNPTDGRDKPNKDVVIVDCGGEEVGFLLLIRVE